LNALNKANVKGYTPSGKKFRVQLQFYGKYVSRTVDNEIVAGLLAKKWRRIALENIEKLRITADEKESINDLADYCARACGPGAFYSQTGVLSDPSVCPSVCACVRPRKREDSPNSISIGFTAPSGGIISRVDFRNPKKIKENREKPNEGRIGRDPVLGPFLRPFLKIKITQCVTATKKLSLEIATVYEGKTAKWRPILELQRPGRHFAVLPSYTVAISSDNFLVAVTHWVIFIFKNGLKKGPKTGSRPILPSFGFSRFSLIFLGFLKSTLEIIPPEGAVKPMLMLFGESSRFRGRTHAHTDGHTLGSLRTPVCE
jgi:hypothetical protein